MNTESNESAALRDAVDDVGELAADVRADLRDELLRRERARRERRADCRGSGLIS